MPTMVEANRESKASNKSMGNTAVRLIFLLINISTMFVQLGSICENESKDEPKNSE